MGAGASIYDNMIRPPAQPMGPVEMMTHAADLKTAIARSQMAPIELQRQQAEADQLHVKAQQAAEDAADQRTSRQVYGEVQGDATVPAEKKHEEFIARLAGQVNPRTVDLLNTQMDAHDKAVQAASNEKLTQAITANKEVSNQLAAIDAVPDAEKPAAYAGVLQNLYRQGLAKPGDLPDAYDPNTVAFHKAAAMGAVNSATAEISRREQANKDAEEKRKARTEELATAGQTIDGVQDQAGYDNWRSKLSPANQALTAATFTPQNVATIKRMALTANQQREADQATATASETQRHNQAEEARATAKPTYSGEMRAALVAVGADPDKPTPEQASAALAKLRTSTTDKPASKATLTAIEQRKSAAIQKSKATLDKELAANTVKGKVLDQDVADQAWEDHIQRLQDAQTGYENELTTATGGDVGHNDWADRLRVPGKAGAPQPSGQTTPPAAAGAAAQVPASASAALPPRPTAIPKGATAQYNPARKQWRYSVDGGKSWQQPTGQ